jgi:hypothetical protein
MEEKNMSFKYFWIIAALFLLAIFLLSIRPIGENDTGLHLMTGEYIVTHGTVPLYDIFSYTAQGMRWIAHYWLSDVVFYFIYLLSGFWGLIIFIALLAALTYFFVLKITWMKAGKTILPLILLVLFAYLALELWVVRPQIFSYFLAVLLVYILEKWRTSSNNKYLYWLPPIFLVWANMHAGIVLGIAIFGLYCAVEVIHKRSFRSVKIPIVIFIVSALATLLNPNGYKVIFYSQIIAPVIKAMGIGEWQSLLNYTSIWQAKVFIVLMIVSFVFVWWQALRKERNFFRIDWISLGLVTGAMVMPLMSIRHIAFFPLLALPVVSDYLSSYLKQKDLRVESVPFAIPLIIVLGIILILGPLLRLNRFSLIDEAKLPEKAANFIKNNNLPEPIFSPQYFNGYLIWKLWPQYKIFKDGRNEVFVGEPDYDYAAILLQYGDWQKLIDDKYRIQTFIVAYPDFENLSGKSIFEAMAQQASFIPVYFDDMSIILVKNNAQNKNIIQKFGYKIINPFVDLAKTPNNLLLQALREAQRALDTTPDSVVSLFLHEAVKFRINHTK